MAVLCYINNKVAYPSLKSPIKITKENPFLHDKDSKTLDVEFPMDIMENRLVFGAVHRVDTSKKLEAFSDCRLMVDNIPVITGTGRVSEITQESVKLQILSGNNSVRYRSEFDKIFIDRIQYVTVDNKYKNSNLPWVYVTDEINSQQYIGDISKYVFMPVIDSTNDCMANMILALMSSSNTISASGLTNQAVQPNLMMVLHTVLQHLGYTVKQNVYDVAPWNELIICSARQTLNIAHALPHWTASKFLDEFRKLFNATFLFDEVAKTVSVVQASSLNEVSSVEYECAEELISSYDEDGIEYLGSSNIKYNLSGLGSERETIPDDVFKEFTIAEYNSTNELINAFNGMSKKEKLTTLLVDPNGYVYGYEEEDGNGGLTGVIGMKRTGVFSPLVRDSESDTYAELNMCPVAMDQGEHKARTTLGTGAGAILGPYLTMTNMLPIIENPDGNASLDAEERGYVSIQDVLEADESPTAEETEESVTMQLMWPARRVFRLDPNQNYFLPLSHTDPLLCNDSLMYSLALSHALNRNYIGKFHERVIRINAGQSVDANNEVNIKFLCNGIPDVNKIYIFHGKAYLCSKAEIEVGAEGIDPLKNGYFYEML